MKEWPGARWWGGELHAGAALCRGEGRTWRVEMYAALMQVKDECTMCAGFVQHAGSHARCEAEWRARWRRVWLKDVQLAKL